MLDGIAILNGTSGGRKHYQLLRLETTRGDSAQIAWASAFLRDGSGLSQPPNGTLTLSARTPQLTFVQRKCPAGRSRNCSSMVNSGDRKHLARSSGGRRATPAHPQAEARWRRETTGFPRNQALGPPCFPQLERGWPSGVSKLRPGGRKAQDWLMRRGDSGRSGVAARGRRNRRTATGRRQSPPRHRSPRAQATAPASPARDASCRAVR